MTTLYVDNIAPNLQSKISAPDLTLPTGSVVQCVSTRFNTNFNTSSTSFAATGHTLSITPSSTNSKIFIVCSGGSWYISLGHAFETIYRTNTGTGGVTNLGDGVNGISRKNGDSGSQYSPHAMQVLDTPNTTNTLTYEARIRSETSGNTTYWAYPGYGYVTMTALEIAG